MLRSSIVFLAIGVIVAGATGPVRASHRHRHHGGHHGLHPGGHHSHFGRHGLHGPHLGLRQFRRGHHTGHPVHFGFHHHRRRADRDGDYTSESTAVPEDCRRVSKIERDSAGRPARIRGTLCFDADGRPYIVEGSRHVMEYLD